MLFSSANLRAAGLANTSSDDTASVAASVLAAAGASASASLGGAASILPASNIANTSSLNTTSTSSLIIDLRVPSAGATISKTTLSVSTSTINSSRSIGSPGFLYQVATVPSAIDSGKVGALISIVMVVPYLFPVEDWSCSPVHHKSIVLVELSVVPYNLRQVKQMPHGRHIATQSLGINHQ